MQAQQRYTLDKTRRFSSSVFKHAFVSTTNIQVRPQNSKCRSKLDQRQVLLSHHTLGLSKAHGFSSSEMVRPARMSASCRDAHSRRTLTTAASATAGSLQSTDLWQWRKAQLYKIAVFTGPALSIPLADPIMSLVDTVCVGQVRHLCMSLRLFQKTQSILCVQFTGTLELAALGPTMLIFNLFTYLFTAITITTVR